MKMAVAKLTAPAPQERVQPVPVGASVANRLAARAFGDDYLERVRVRRSVDQHLAATDRPMPPIRPGSTSVRLAEVSRSGMQIALTGPPEEVGVAFARALTPAVEEQDAVAVADEHARLLLRARPAGKHDHGRAVPRWDEPALEAEAVARREVDVLVGGAQARGRHLRADHSGRDHHGRRRRRCVVATKRRSADSVAAETSGSEGQTRAGKAINRLGLTTAGRVARGASRPRAARYAITMTIPPATASKMKWLPVATIVNSMNGG